MIFQLKNKIKLTIKEPKWKCHYGKHVRRLKEQRTDVELKVYKQFFQKTVLKQKKP